MPETVKEMTGAELLQWVEDHVPVHAGDPDGSWFEGNIGPPNQAKDLRREFLDAEARAVVDVMGMIEAQQKRLVALSQFVMYCMNGEVPKPRVMGVLG